MAGKFSNRASGPYKILGIVSRIWCLAPIFRVIASLLGGRV